MGMFDTIYLHESLIPVIPELQQRGIHIGSEDDFQTKDLECCLYEYRVGEDRKLMLRVSQYDTIKTPDSPLPFSVKEVSYEMVHDTSTCEAYCVYYNPGEKHDDDDIWLDLKVVIIRGIVDSVEVHKLEIKSSSPRLTQLESWRTTILHRDKSYTYKIRRKLATMCGRIANFFNTIQNSLLKS